VSDSELGRGAGLEPLLDQIENAVGSAEVLACDPQPVLCREHLEIGVADRRDGRQNDDLLVEAAGDRSLLRCARGSAILAPEVDLVARVERGMKKVALGRAGLKRSAKPTKLTAGKSGAPTILAWASACRMRPMAAPMSKLASCASSIRLVSSRERKPRHQSSAGGADTPPPAPYLGGISAARSGRSELNMHPDSICTRDNPINTTKTGRRPLALIAGARVRHPSNMGPTFNATDTRWNGALALTPRTPSPTAHWPTRHSTSPAPADHLIKRHVRLEA